MSGEIKLTNDNFKIIDVDPKIIKEMKRRLNEKKINKTCGCGNFFEYIPHHAIICTAGHHWFNCECKSTLLVRGDR